MSFKFNITEPEGSKNHVYKYFRNSSDQVQQNKQIKYKTTAV